MTKSILPSSPASRRAVGLMGRIGYAARGAIYLLVGVSAGVTTIWPEHRPGGLRDSLEPLGRGWAGAAVLLLLAAGLACLAGWFAVAALSRRDHRGPARYVLIAGMLGDAVVYIGFVAAVLTIFIGAASGGDHELQSWIAWLFAYAYGRALAGVVGAIVLGGGAGQIVWAAIGDIEGSLALPRTERRLMRPVGRFGIAGRGVAIACIGCTLCAAAIHGNPGEAHELGGVFAALRTHFYGVAAIALFALAFIGSSVLDFVVALFRRFDPTDP